MSRPHATLCVFGATPLLTVTAEPGRNGSSSDIHIHAGGQGFWISRMAAQLGEAVVLCSPVGGESGAVFMHMAERVGVHVDAVPIEGHTAAYIHDRRSGKRLEIAHSGYPTLGRHELDELYGRTIAHSLSARLCVLAGYPAVESVPTSIFRRLTADLRAQHVQVVGDLAGEPLTAALEGGLDLLKLSDEEAVASGYARTPDLADLEEAAARLVAGGARRVVITRAELPMLARLEGRSYLVDPPRLEVVDHRGAGDATTAALAVAVRRGLSEERMLKLACAAGAATVARHGLASAARRTIEHLAERVELVPLRAG